MSYGKRYINLFECLLKIVFVNESLLFINYHNDTMALITINTL